MSRRKKKPASGGTPLLKNGIYAKSGAGPKRRNKKQMAMANAKTTAESKRALEKGKKMLEIEEYAKKHKITITQAMIHFMD